MNSTSVYVIAFGLGLVIAASLVFSAASNAVNAGSEPRATRNSRS